MWLPLIIGVCILGLLYVALLVFKILSYDEGNEKMREIAQAIREGALAFLRSEYQFLVVFVLILAIIIWFVLDDKATVLNEGGFTAVAFIIGAFSSGLAGYLGMRIATAANVRTTQAAKTSLGQALNVAFSSGSVMGLTVVSLGLLGLTVLYWVYTQYFGLSAVSVASILTGFAFGASSIALFARVGGGIYTKGADVGADLVGKLEAGIPEDDPRNPATIADNVGDNVGDVAGIGADLFESYVGSIVAAMI